MKFLAATSGQHQQLAGLQLTVFPIVFITVATANTVLDVVSARRRLIDEIPRYVACERRHHHPSAEPVLSFRQIGEIHEILDTAGRNDNSFGNAVHTYCKLRNIEFVQSPYRFRI